MIQFTYNGISSADMGIRIQSKSIYSAPKYDISSVSIPGRDGELLVPSGRFSNATVWRKVDCYKGVALYRT